MKKTYKFLIIGILLYSINFFSVKTPIYNFSSYLFTGVRAQAYNQTRSIGYFLAFFVNLHNLYNQNLSLKNRIVTLEGKIAQDQSILEENQALKAQLKVASSSNYNYIMANLTSLSNNSLSYVTLNKGYKNDVRVGQMVTYQSFLIGIVTDVYAYSSKVKLIYFLNNSIPVKVENSSVSGELVGSINNNLSMEDIYSNESVNIGDVVVTSGIDGTYLPDLPIGTISSINITDGAPYKTALVKSPIDVSDLNEVFIIK